MILLCFISNKKLKQQQQERGWNKNMFLNKNQRLKCCTYFIVINNMLYVVYIFVVLWDNMQLIDCVLGAANFYIKKYLDFTVC